MASNKRRHDDELGGGPGEGRDENHTAAVGREEGAQPRAWVEQAGRSWPVQIARTAIVLPAAGCLLRWSLLVLCAVR